MRGLSLLDVAFLGRQQPVSTDWAARVVANGGAMPSAPTIAAMETFRLGMISAGLDTKMHALCVFVPDSLIAATTPLFVGIGSDPWTNNNFVGGDLTVEGLVGNGSTKYLDTGVQATSGQAVDAGTGNCGLSLIVTDSVSSSDSVELGRTDALSSSQPSLYMQVSSGNGVNNSTFSTSGNSNSDQTRITDGFRVGFVSSNSVGGTLNMYVGGPNITLYSLTSKAVATMTTANTDTIKCFALGTTGSGVTNYSAKRLSVAAIHEGLSSGDAATLMSLMLTLRNSLGGGNGDIATGWSNRVVLAGGVAPSGGTLTALRTFVSSLDSAGIASKMYSVLPVAPDSLTAARTPLFANVGLGIWTNNNFVGGDLTVDGLIGNASTKYLQTGIICANLDLFPAGSGGCSDMMFDASSTGTSMEIGAIDGSSNVLGLQRVTPGNNMNAYCWGIGGGDAFFTVALPSNTWPGFVSINRTATNALALYGASQATAFNTLASNSTAQTRSTGANVEMYAWALNSSGAAGSFSGKRMSFLAAHAGLTSTECQALYNAVAALRTSLGGGNA